MGQSLNEVVWKRSTKSVTQNNKKDVTLYPWNLIPDNVILAWAFSILLPALPLFAFLITSTEVVWYAMIRVCNMLPFLYTLRSATAKYFENIGAQVFKDKRNAPYLFPILWLTVATPSLFYWAYSSHAAYGFSVTTLLTYHFLRLLPRYRSFAYLHVLLHKEGHDANGFFKWEFLNFGVLHFFVGIFYGALPYSYSMYHNKIHHHFDGDIDDVGNTNVDLDRSSPWAIMYYFPRFLMYWSGLTPLIYFISVGKWRFAANTVVGQIYMGICWFACYKLAGFWFTLLYLFFPFIESTLFFGGISYLWHAFCDPSDPQNPYVDSITIVGGLDNIYNEDFHVVHHTKPMIHWTEYEQHYKDNVDQYEKYNATIFTDCEEGMLLYWLFAQKWDEMVDHFVDLSGKLTREEKKELLLYRLKARFERVPQQKLDRQRETQKKDN